MADPREPNLARLNDQDLEILATWADDGDAVDEVTLALVAEVRRLRVLLVRVQTFAQRMAFDAPEATTEDLALTVRATNILCCATGADYYAPLSRVCEFTEAEIAKLRHSSPKVARHIAKQLAKRGLGFKQKKT